jgi:hypothetical protein
VVLGQVVRDVTPRTRAAEEVVAEQDGGRVAVAMDLVVDLDAREPFEAALRVGEARGQAGRA